jgi:predicted small secreted protein
MSPSKSIPPVGVLPPCQYGESTSYRGYECGNTLNLAYFRKYVKNIIDISGKIYRGIIYWISVMKKIRLFILCATALVNTACGTIGGALSGAGDDLRKAGEWIKTR